MLKLTNFVSFLSTAKRAKEIDEEEEKVKKFKAAMSYNATMPSSSSSKPKSNQLSDFSSW